MRDPEMPFVYPDFIPLRKLSLFQKQLASRKSEVKYTDFLTLHHEFRRKIIEIIKCTSYQRLGSFPFHSFVFSAPLVSRFCFL